MMRTPRRVRANLKPRITRKPLEPSVRNACAHQSMTISTTESVTTATSKMFHPASSPCQKSRHPRPYIFKTVSKTKMKTSTAFAVPNQLGTSLKRSETDPKPHDFM